MFFKNSKNSQNLHQKHNHPKNSGLKNDDLFIRN
jgi:hypothetical protein